MNKLQWLFVVAFSMSLAACGGGGEKKDSLFGPDSQPVQEGADQAATDTTSDIKTNAPDQGGSVEVIGANEDPQVSGGESAAGENLGTGESLSEAEMAAAEEGAKTFEPVIYFGYDQFTVSDESLETIKHYADALLSNEALKLTLTGHTDERGTPEYNLALGERRANAVQEAFMLFGVSQSRIEALSMGEEQPLVDEHNEEAYAQNRRADINIH